ncbi:MAG: transposase [Caldisphaeraceae archaeon]|nr:transposase [Caldisphaeraceae archaeon]
MIKATRTVIVRSVKLPKKLFKVFVELEGMYRNMVEQLVMDAVKNNVKGFIRLKAFEYKEMRGLYPKLPSHYAYTACQDASTRAKGFLKLKKLSLSKRNYPEVKKITIWLDDKLWKPSGLTLIKISTHKGWVAIEIEPHKQYWKYVNRGWKVASEVKVKIDKKNKQLIIYLTFAKGVEEYKPKGYLPVDINENNVTMLIDSVAYLFETNVEKLVLGYYYRRKKIQERYDKVYGKSRIKRKALKKLKEKEKKFDIKWKIANIIVKKAYERHYAIVLENLGKKATNNMIARIKNKQLRHSIFQASFKGIQKAIEEESKEYGISIIYVNPKNTSRLCPIHNATIIYTSRIGRCSKGKEMWHRDAVATWNLYLRVLKSGGSNAPSPSKLRCVPRAVGDECHP